MVDTERLVHSPSWCCREQRAGCSPAEPWVQPCTAPAFVLPSLVRRGTGTGQPWLGRQRPCPGSAGPEWRGWPEHTAPCGSLCREVAGAALALCTGLQPRGPLAAGLWQQCSAGGACGATASPGASSPTAPCGRASGPPKSGSLVGQCGGVPGALPPPHQPQHVGGHRAVRWVLAAPSCVLRKRRFAQAGEIHVTWGARQEEPAAAPRRALVPAAQPAMAPWLPTKEEKYGVGECRLWG